MISLEQKIEAVLFATPEPVAVSSLVKMLGVSVEEIEAGIAGLETQLVGRGITLVRNDEHISLGTIPEMSEILDALKKEELNRELSRAALETLSIVMYRPDGASRSEIDYIRGVNSSFILRNLLMRGLIERTGGGRPTYKPTMDMLAFMGVPQVAQLPNYEEISNKLSQELADMTKSE